MKLNANKLTAPPKKLDVEKAIKAIHGGKAATASKETARFTIDMPIEVHTELKKHVAARRYNSIKEYVMELIEKDLLKHDK